MTELIFLAGALVLVGAFCAGWYAGGRDTRGDLEATLDAAQNDWLTALVALRRLRQVEAHLTADQRRVLHGIERAAARRGAGPS